MLDLHRLAVLRQFQVSGSINATAQVLGYSPSAISQQLTALERETGAVLVERTARSASLTDAGRLLARHARSLIDAAEAAQAELAASLDQVSGALVITTIPSLAAAVARAVVSVQRDHPQVEIVMRQSATEGAATAIADHQNDIAVTDDWAQRAGRAPEGLARQNVFTEAVVLAVPHDHPLALDDGPLGARDFAAAAGDMTWLCAPERHPSRIAGDRRLHDMGVRPRRRWEFEGLATIAQLVGGGTGCALLPETVAATQPRSRLAIRRLSPAMTRRIQVLTRAGARQNPAVRACTSAITAELEHEAPAPAIVAPDVPKRG